MHVFDTRLCTCDACTPTGYNDAATAEVALMLILMLLRRVDGAR